ncbi:hypothetical protein CMQ_842 [Grosmannia clavigera kw1407]|uniref:Uncharacterized protein n=1 Tax=Grosmannia clavigera (strain kw1407 / UAMH 11150) TaxID=655863 RepID=F0XF56_GROCL|nr:uncharacterized protein CMQ_842 [Grosmannia clavigera kw1407]EFX03914.1 hypothetical protein CMQ_842 [Grosmannia clavigera kw1407]
MMQSTTADRSHVDSVRTTVEETLVTCDAGSELWSSVAFEHLSVSVVEAAVEALACCFGLSHVLHTVFGSEVVRGLSCGERRRALLAEADLVCLDSPTNGPDGSTAIDKVTCREPGAREAVLAALDLGDIADELVGVPDLEKRKRVTVGVVHRGTYARRLLSLLL